jgi:hypothetical protein
MASNFNDTTPAAPSGYTNVKWQTDGAGNDSAYVSFSSFGGVNSQSASYAIASSDGGQIVSLSSGTYTFTLPSPPSSKWGVFIQNAGTGVLTVSPGGLNIDGSSSSLTLYDGQGVYISTDGTNYFTSRGMQVWPFDVPMFAPGVGTNNQKLVRLAMVRNVSFPAGAANSYAVASANCAANTTYTFNKNGTPFATCLFAMGGATGAFTQASTATFAPGDLLEVDGPATADVTLADVGIVLYGFRIA